MCISIAAAAADVVGRLKLETSLREAESLPASVAV
jgi:hypothetical protein